MERTIDEFLANVREKNLFRSLTQVIPLGGGRIRIDEKEYTNFSSNDYLGLSGHPDIIKAVQNVAGPVFASSSSRLMTGTSLHMKLEKAVAIFKQKESALVFNSGYQANVGIISALFGKGDVVFSDKLNHASIVDGIRLSGAKLFRFRHNDTEHLEGLLNKERKNFRNALLVTETVFSMDGDIAPIPEMVGLKDEFDCLFMVDEAHATGIFGDHGSGVVELAGRSADVDIVMGTFSKALGGFGAYAAFSHKIRNFLINTCRSFIYSTALPASVIAADLESLCIIKNEPHRRKTLLSNAAYFRKSLQGKGFEVSGESQIIPIVVGENAEALALSEFLRDKGYWVTPVRPPTVPKGSARIRISLSYDHTKEILDNFLNVAGAVSPSVMGREHIGT